MIWRWLSLFALCFGLLLGTSDKPAEAAETGQISVNNLGYIDYLALAIRLGAKPGALAEEIPLDRKLNPFEARNLRFKLIEEAIELSQALPASRDQISLSLDSHLILISYDFSNQEYQMCLPQAIHIKNHYPDTSEFFPKIPSVQFTSRIKINECADRYSLMQMNSVAVNPLSFGLYISLPMQQSNAEDLYNAFGGDGVALHVQYICSDLILTRDHNIICGKIGVSTDLSSRQLVLDISTNGNRQPQTQWTWR
ncbi:MAG: hypothetical protein AAGL23_01450 [Pseudomonadota bacterium]